MPNSSSLLKLNLKLKAHHAAHHAKSRRCHVGNNVFYLYMSTLYCGKRRTAPPGKVMGTKGKCLQKGVGVGASLFEFHRPLNTLLKDEVRVLATRLAIKGYSNMTVAQLIAAVEGSRRYHLGIQPQNWYRLAPK